MTRAAFLRRLSRAPLLGALPCLQAGRAAQPTAGKTRRAAPNIVYILADDLGYGDVRCFNPNRGRIPTPNLDHLASQGMRFTDAHSGSAVCSPTRYGILTGRHAWRSRLQKGVLGPYDAPLIAASRLTVPGLLREQGYHTACIGKWHLGWNWPRAGGKVVFDKPITGGPTSLGFDFYFGTDVPNYPPYCFIENDRTAGIPSIEKPKEIYGNPGPMLPGWQLEAILPALGAKAADYIGDRAGEKAPFFLYLPLTAPHTPLAVAEPWKGKTDLGMYGDYVAQTDGVVGEVLRALDRHGVSGDTLVMFTSDNGCTPVIGLTGETRMGQVKELEARGHYPSASLRGYKSDIWEGGHRIPLIARWPGVVKPGSVCEEVCCLTDLMATCAEILGVRVPASAAEDSVSLLHLLKGSPGRPREAVVHHSIEGKFAIRQGKWKLALCPGSGGWSEPRDGDAVARGLPSCQLYDMSTDIGERKNLQDRHPEIVQRLRRLLEDYVARGRSTPGPPLKNDAPIDIWKDQP